MRWQAHLLLGLASGAAVGWMLGLEGANLARICAIAGFFSLLPDIDLQTSKISQIVRFALVLALVAVGLALGSVLAVVALLAGIWAAWVLLLPRHRGITHTLLFAFFCFAAVFVAVGWAEGLAAFAGVLSHLAADRIGK